MDAKKNDDDDEPMKTKRVTNVRELKPSIRTTWEEASSDLVWRSPASGRDKRWRPLRSKNDPGIELEH